MVTDNTTFTPKYEEVSTMSELLAAIDERKTHLLLSGDLVQNFRNHRLAKKVLIIVSMAFVVLGIFTTPFLGGGIMFLSVAGILLGAGTLAFKGFPFAVPFSFRTLGVKNSFKIMKSGKAWFNNDGTVAAVIRYKE